MGLLANIKNAKRSITRRKTKNVSAILAITLGVTLMVGIQITTDTLENTFLTSLLLGQGEVDLSITNGTSGSYLSSADLAILENAIPDAKGIMAELTYNGPAMVGSQFEETIQYAGIPLDYPEVFGEFYDYNGEKMNLDQYLVNNESIIISSRLAEKLDLNETTTLPVILKTEFVNTTNIFNPIYNVTVQSSETLRVNLSVVAIYDSSLPGVSSQYRGAIFALEYLQDWVSLQDPFRFSDIVASKDIVGSYHVSFKGNHLNEEIDEVVLENHVETVNATLNEGTEKLKYSVLSIRLTYIDIIGFAFTMMSTMLNVLGILIVLTGVLLITNVQLMSVEDREFQTGVLRAVGENRRGIFQSFLFETLFQGFMGGIVGLIGGLVFGQAVALYLAQLFGTGRFSVQPVISQDVIGYSVLLGVFLGVVTGLLPAVRASRVNIVEALRGIKFDIEQRTSRNFLILGILLTLVGIYFLITNGIIKTDLDYIWETAGWDSLDEWENILYGAGFLSIGIGILLSRFLGSNRALNLTSFALWGAPVFLFAVAMGEGWIIDMERNSINILLVGIIELVLGSVLVVGLNLSPLMHTLRNTFIRIRGIKGVAQVAPSLISSHKTRSTLTFAIFAVVLTLNVTVATLVETNFSSSIGQSELDSRGIDLVVRLTKPEVALNDTSFIEEVYKLDSHIEDIIGLKTYHPGENFFSYALLSDPMVDPTNLMPLGYTELSSEQVRGEATSYADSDWRYDFYLEEFPVDISTAQKSDLNDEEQLEITKKSYDAFFDPTYQMAAYNLSFSLESLDFESMGSSGFGGGTNWDELDKLVDENGSIITNPIVFTDSFILPMGLQVWIPMNITYIGMKPVVNYQPFTIAGKFDSDRAGGFPLGTSMSAMAGGDGFGSGILGNLYIPGHFSNMTNFFGKADGDTINSREPDQYDSFLIKTSYAFDDPTIEGIGRKIEEFTNTDNEGYRELIDDSFIVATSFSIYSELQSSLEMMNQMVSFLQIYVSFGLIIGAVGMGVISVRNVAERKREIGMMRAIGFPRSQVILSVLLELVVLGAIGLIIGVVNGLMINVGFANMQNVALVIPWSTITAYLTFITFVALLAGAIPGWVAARIPPSEALRYVG